MANVVSSCCGAFRVSQDLPQIWPAERGRHLTLTSRASQYCDVFPDYNSYMDT